MYNRRRLLYTALLFCMALTFFSFRSAGPGRDGKKHWVIVIDPGHGGKDPGCHGKRLNEKDVALAVSLKFGHLIEENNKDVTVIYTRKTDVFVALNERAEIANRDHADLFVCIHCNASLMPDAAGAATYVMGLSKSEGNLEISKRENSSILYEKDYKQTYGGFDPNSDEAAVLFAMYQNLYLEQSLDFSTRIQKEYSELVKTNDHGVKQAGFLVLWKTAMPSLLTEIGFLTNVAEEKVLGSQKGQDEIAKSIFLAFEQYKAEKEGVAYTPGSYDLSPLVLKSMEDTVSTDSIVKAPIAMKAPDTTPAKKAIVKVDSTPKTPVAIVHKPANKKIATTDSNTIRARKMQEALKAQHIDTVAAMPKKAEPVAVIKPKDSIAVLPKLKAIHDSVIPKPVVAAIVKPARDSTVAKSQISDDSNRLIYKVQFAVSPRPLSVHDSKYLGIPDIDMYKDNTIYKYTAGHFYTVKDAADLQNKLRTEGYKDAFVVTFRGSKRVVLPKVSSK